MSEKPILFSAPMVRAILDGSKTQTRRVCKLAYRGSMPEPEYESFIQCCPYGQPGDQLWVRETWSVHAILDGRAPRYIDAPVTYAADGPGSVLLGRLRPSIHMPRWASRITLEIVSVRVEQLKDISEADAIAEGAQPILVPPDGGGCPHVEGYRELWESINGQGSWNDNPFVWCVEFKRIKP